MNLKQSTFSKTATAPITQQTFRRPVPIVKKHSRPLSDILAEVNKIETTYLPTGLSSPLSKTPNVTRPSPTPTRRRPNLKDKDKKRERWLLTRKTWRYMTDAGRKLIPDGVQNRQEDIPKIEVHFQKVCALEPNFVLWRRKYSYPGALRNSKKRLKQLLHHTGQKSQQVLEKEEIDNADIVLELLHNHLNLSESIKTDTLLGTKTVGPHQTDSPSAQRPKPLKRAIRNRDAINISLRGPGFLPSPAYDDFPQQSASDQLLQRLLTLSRSTTLLDTINIPPEQINVALLNDKTTLKNIYNALKKQQLHRIFSKHSMPLKPCTNLIHSMSTLSLLHSDRSQARTETKNTTLDVFYKIQSPTDTTVTPASPLLSSSSFGSTKAQQKVASSLHDVPQRQRKPPSSLNLLVYSNTSSISSKKSQLYRHIVPEKQFNSCGTQTNFIPLSEMKRLAIEYKDYKKELAADGGGNTTTDDECEKLATLHSSRRKSSIDNEDVSQSVSDTIKRYLRMARKKSVPDDKCNRFKRVNYDRNLRNIQAKGEINPPGMDENNNKAVQTLDAWALITLDFVRGDVNSGVLEIAHNDWQKSLEQRLRRKLEYEQKTNQPPNSVIQSTSSCSSSAPTSPVSNQSPTMTNITSASSSKSVNDTRLLLQQLNVDANFSAVSGSNIAENSSPVSGIFYTGSQFIANLWHGSSSQSNLSSPTSNEPIQQKLTELGATLSSDEASVSVNHTDMKKSKSFSHVGHYFSAKLHKSQSKNQPKLIESLPINPSNVFGYPKWSKTSKCTWKSETGECITLRDTAFHTLSELEAKTVTEVCMERIIELDIGIDLNDLTERKSSKKHPLTKMRAMTTSFFDIGKKESNNQNLSVFGNSLEACIISGKKLEMSNLITFSDRGSRNSIASLFRSGSSIGRKIQNAANMDTLNKNESFCENLVTEPKTLHDNSNAASNIVGKSFEKKSKYKIISRSQSDVRRYSHDNSEHANIFQGNDADIRIMKELKVPKFVTCCIKFLEDNGLHKVGIFRVSTSRKKIQELRKSLEKSNEWRFDDDTCPHNVATLLKEFLRDLPEPLLLNHLYKAFLKTQKIRNRRLQLEALSHLVKLLPPAHLDTLYVLLKFLAKVAASCDDVCDNNGVLQLTGNKMDSYNLATVFAPNILRSTVNDKSSPSGDNLHPSNEQMYIDDAINVIRIMIDHYEELFLVPADILDIVLSHLLDVAPEQLNAICEYRKTTWQNITQLY